MFYDLRDYPDLTDAAIRLLTLRDSPQQDHFRSLFVGKYPQTTFPGDEERPDYLEERLAARREAALNTKLNRYLHEAAQTHHLADYQPFGDQASKVRNGGGRGI